MAMGWRPIVAGACALIAAQCVSAGTATFQLIPNASSANDMSPDGRFVVGETTTGKLYRWDTTTNTTLILPSNGISAIAVSDDGKFIAGSIIDNATQAEVAALWSETTNTWQSLGYLPNALSCPSRSNAYEISADGSVVVGLSWDGCDGRGFRWTQATGMVELEPLANGGNRASVLSADGNVIGGFAQGSFSRTPTVWDGTTNNGELLNPPNGDAVGEVHGMSDDGTVMVGEYNGDAVKWTAPLWDRTTLGIGSIINGWTGIPQDVASDGTVVGFDILSGNRRAWIRPDGTGPLLLLKTYLEGLGATVSIQLEVCQAVSADGNIMIGHGFGTGAWIARLPIEEAPCTGDIVDSGTFQPPSDGVVDGADLAFLLGEWGRNPGSPADFVDSNTFEPPADGKVDGADLAVLLGAWGSCN